MPRKILEPDIRIMMRPRFPQVIYDHPLIQNIHIPAFTAHHSPLKVQPPSARLSPLPTPPTRAPAKSTFFQKRRPGVTSPNAIKIQT